MEMSLFLLSLQKNTLKKISFYTKTPEFCLTFQVAQQKKLFEKPCKNTHTCYILARKKRVKKVISESAFWNLMLMAWNTLLGLHTLHVAGQTVKGLSSKHNIVPPRFLQMAQRWQVRDSSCLQARYFMRLCQATVETGHKRGLSATELHVAHRRKRPKMQILKMQRIVPFTWHMGKRRMEVVNLVL